VNDALDARIEVARGEMVIGGLVVPMAMEGAAAQWRLGGPAGPLLRALSYGERTRLCALAAISDNAHASLAAAVARAATVIDGDVEDVVRAVAALLLCGAREAGAPFSETLLRVARAGGWDLAHITDAPAADIDRLAAALGVAPADDGWRRLVFDDGQDPSSPAAVRDSLVDNLLARVDDRLTAPVEAEPEEAAAVSGDAAVADMPESWRPSNAAMALQGDAPRPALVVSERWSSRAAARTVSPVNPSPAPGGSRIPASAVTARAGGAAGVARAASSVPVRVSDLSAQHPAAPWSATAARRPSPGFPDRLGLSAASRADLAPVARPASQTGAGWFGRSVSPPTPPASVPQRSEGPAPSQVAADLADALADLLQDEADLRGVE
jgi:hypothetical protein